MPWIKLISHNPEENFTKNIIRVDVKPVETNPLFIFHLQQNTACVQRQASHVYN